MAAFNTLLLQVDDASEELVSEVYRLVIQHSFALLCIKNSGILQPVLIIAGFQF